MTERRERLVVIGNGMAGIACLEKLLKLAPGRFEITVFSAERYPNYNRIQLSAVLAGDMGWDDVIMNPEQWYADHGIRLHLGVPVEGIDRDRKVVIGRGGIEEPYDKVLVATGSTALILPLPGKDLEGVVTFRTIDDCKAMVDAAARYGRAVVIGGGLLGLEAARGLKNLGMEVHIVHLAHWLMERQLDAVGGQYLARAIRAQGISVHLSKQTESIEGDTRVTGLRFKDGGVLETDFVVMAAGIRPNSTLAREAGLDCNRGIVVDDYMRTSDPDIFAVGECAEHRGVCYGLVAPLYEQGVVLAASLSGNSTSPYSGSVLSTKLKVSGVDVFSVGVFDEDDDCEVMRVEDSGTGVYKKAVIRGGVLSGAVLVGDISRAQVLEGLARSARILNGERATLLSESAACGPAAPGDGEADLLSLADDTVICGCNGVTKGTIVNSIRSQNLLSRKEVAACTNASRSCGGCSGQVEQLLRLVQGEAVAQGAQVKPVCDCTDLPREQVISAIREHHLTSVREVMNTLGWKGEGCAVCRPAINYYLTMAWPGENEDDPRSRFVNERLHANIQKDGTYSVVPRMYGGVTTPEELMRIATVASRYNVPMVKITGGQRIDLLGVKKDQLPSIWSDLELPSGFAYAKGIRTVKTCVGSTFCRFGTRDSMTLGIRIEKTFENLWTPAKVKMAVNGCPRNCAESLIKDVGLIAVDTAWEIYVGGNGGVHIRKGDLLSTVESDDDALDVIAAFLQLYREEAGHNIRTSVWVEEVGIDYVKRVVEDPERRTELICRMRQALVARVEPWAERVRRVRERDPEMLREFVPLRIGGAEDQSVSEGRYQHVS